jgi:hypothetical protein
MSTSAVVVPAQRRPRDEGLGHVVFAAVAAEQF